MGIDIGKIAGAVGGALVAGPAGAIAGYKIGGSDAAHDAADTVRHVAYGVGKGLIVSGVTVLNAVGDALASIIDLIPGSFGVRDLRTSERDIATKVFGTTLPPLDRILICSLCSPDGGRPFTIHSSVLTYAALQMPLLGPLLSIASMIGLHDKYILFLGPAGYRNSIDWNRGDGQNFKGQTLVHEFTHVWQSWHGKFSTSYMLNSLRHQCTCKITGVSAYAYKWGDQWDSYDAEPQAHIVEDWFVLTNGADPTNDSQRHLRQPYIDCNIRAGNRVARTVWPPYTSIELKAAADALTAHGRTLEDLAKRGAGVGALMQGQAEIAAARNLSQAAKQLSRQELFASAKQLETEAAQLLALSRKGLNILYRAQAEQKLILARQMRAVAEQANLFV